MTKKYDDVVVFSDANMSIKRGEKVSFVGRNGEGKSTMIKAILGQIDYEGECSLGHNVQVGYFAQNQASLMDENLTVFQTIDEVAKGDVRTKIKKVHITSLNINSFSCIWIFRKSINDSNFTAIFIKRVFNMI